MRCSLCCFNAVNISLVSQYPSTWSKSSTVVLEFTSTSRFFFFMVIWHLRQAKMAVKTKKKNPYGPIWVLIPRCWSHFHLVVTSWFNHHIYITVTLAIVNGNLSSLNNYCFIFFGLLLIPVIGSVLCNLLLQSPEGCSCLKIAKLSLMWLLIFHLVLLQKQQLEIHFYNLWNYR